MSCKAFLIQPTESQYQPKSHNERKKCEKSDGATIKVYGDTTQYSMLEQGALEPLLDDKKYDEMDSKRKKNENKTKYQKALIQHYTQADMCKKQTK